MSFENHQSLFNSNNNEDNCTHTQNSEYKTNLRNLNNNPEKPIYLKYLNNHNKKSDSSYNNNYQNIEEPDTPEFNPKATNPNDSKKRLSQIPKIKFKPYPNAEIVECKLKIFRRNSMSSNYSYFDSNLANNKEISSNEMNNQEKLKPESITNCNINFIKDKKNPKILNTKIDKNKENVFHKADYNFHVNINRKLSVLYQTFKN